MKILSVCIIFMLTCVSAWAIPATNLELNYDFQHQTLHIQANHPTDRPDRYFIRRVLVTRNSSEEQSFNFPRQTNPTVFQVELLVKAEEGDHLDIQLFSSEGGVAAGTIDIPKNEVNDEQKTLPVGN